MAPDKESSLDVERKSVLDECVVHKAPWTAFPGHLHEYMRSGLSEEDAQFLYRIPKKEQDRIFHKVDWRLCPMLAILYLISHLDRANIGNAKIEGLEDTLGMSGTDYNVTLMVFFVPYVLCEVPSNMILAKFQRPSYYMGALILCWGTFRMALFYCASAASGAFSGLLAAAIAKMNGVGNYEGWRWIFILEGLATVIMGVAVFWLLPDSPGHAAGRWLTEDESHFLRLNHIMTRGVLKKPVEEEGKRKRVDWKLFWTVVKDWQIYLQAMIFASNAVPNYGLKFTMPQILRNMGYTSTSAQLLTAPPYACGAISALLSSLLADRFTWRMPFIVSAQALLVVAYAILFAKAEDIRNNVALCYFAVHVACVGIYPILPGCNAWTINNLAGPAKRAIGIAMMICIGNLGGIVGSFIYQEREAPKYPTGFGSSLSFAAAGMVCALTLEFLYWRLNKKGEEKTEDEWKEVYSEEELDRLGDRSPLFRYQL
ncbi:MFS general substrate transporter [Lentithecium fluviatile CBS 122367]|uniref:MFS general substrate transporter n=1 Tax=Lentithecium fluviatile CBS 122367 TaxID=1168545 RepID=A0A6G1IJY4_9PLEO|nr:MFS general substrate transporter [Lentithecium fluviatile CBS 122367]